MTDRRFDRELGMDRPISRRDLIHGAGALAVAMALRDGSASAQPNPQQRMPVDPPARTGLRGCHRGSFEVAHARALDGKTDWGPIVDTGEKLYDLVVVGAGISGLSAAWFYRSLKPEARILILENHDDFGGHAKRNEFHVGDRLLLAHGGSQTLQEPGRYSQVARQLLREVGVDLEAFDDAFDRSLFARLKLATGSYFDRETFGTDRLVRHDQPLFREFLSLSTEAPPLREALASFPIAEPARQQLAALYSGTLGEKHPGWRELPLAELSYQKLLAHLGVDHPEALAYLNGIPAPLFCVGIDALPALYALALGLPGPQGEHAQSLSEPYIHHFPDGNASLARLLVRQLIPEAMPGTDMRDVATVAARYDELDRDGRPVRLRLQSTVVHVAHAGDPSSAEEVELLYVRQNRAERVRARHCVLACYNMMIPFICPDVPPEQAEALRSLVKSPLVYSNVVLRNWQPFTKLGVAATYSPGRWHHFAYLDFPVSIGSYQYPQTPDQPIVLHMDWEPCAPGLPYQDQFRAGRKTLLRTPFEAIEREIRTHLGGMLGGGGFDPANDILALTVNRWPHGYAPEREDGPASQQPHVIGRRPVGRITIANSDSGARAYIDAAIDQAWRAVGELS